MIAPRTFWKYLVLIIIVTLGALMVWNLFLPKSDAFSTFTMICMATFTAINILAYYAAIRAINSKSKYRFVQLMMMLILFKMIICVGLVVAHVKINQPDTKLFVLPFLTIYLIFTLFEIYVLEKLARTNHSTSQSR